MRLDRMRADYAAKKAEGVCVDTGCHAAARHGVRCRRHARVRRLKMQRRRS